MRIAAYVLLSCLYFYLAYIFLCIPDFSKWKMAVKITILFILSIGTYLAASTAQYLALSLWSGLVLLLSIAELFLPQCRKGCVTVYAGNPGKFILFCAINAAAAIGFVVVSAAV